MARTKSLDPHLPARAMVDEFRTIAEPVSVTTKVEGSRFLALATPVESKPHAEESVASVRRRYFDATHHCFAYRLGTDGAQFRFNDDGEPAGTAGRPILASIDKFGLTNALVVVTRYFGGTKLGTGGLARAYGDSAEKALEGAKIVQQYVTEALTLTFPHSQTGNVMRVISKLNRHDAKNAKSFIDGGTIDKKGSYGIQVCDTRYDKKVHLKIRVRKSLQSLIEQELTDVTSGNVSVRKAKSA